MSLQIELDELYRGFTKKVPPDVLNTMLDATRRIVDSGIAETSLKVGENAPDFNLPNPLGKPSIQLVYLNQVLIKTV